MYVLVATSVDAIIHRLYWQKGGACIQTLGAHDPPQFAKSFIAIVLAFIVVKDCSLRNRAEPSSLLL
jgi:hypothetical protein